MAKILFFARYAVAAFFLLGSLSIFIFIAAPAKAAGTNIIPNPSLETVSGTDSTLPASWVKEKAGTNTTVFSYLTTGRTGSRSVKVEMTSRTSGDSHFKFDQQTVTPSAQYDFSFYYQSNVTTEVDAEITLANGSLAYIYIGDVPASASWNQYTATVTMPATAAKATVYATIYSVGYLITDDYSMAFSETTPPEPDGNIVPNPSVETVSTSNSSLPAYWTKEKSGSNTTTFSYLTTGRTGSRSLKVNTTRYTSGDAHFKFNPQAVTAGAEYEFSFYYQSNLYGEVDAEYHLSNGQTTYQYIGYTWPTPTWNQFSTRLTMPADAVTATIYVGTASKGYITTDDYSLVRATTPVPLNRAIVTLTYDEMSSNVYTYGYPLFQKYNIKGDLYLLSSELGTSGMMSKNQLYAYRDFGFEIGSHTITHPHLPQISSTQLATELGNSQTALSNYFGIPITQFASPYGEYNPEAITQIKNYYQSHRTTDVGFNSKDNFDPYLIKAFSIESNMSADYVKNLINQAALEKTWLVLVYHDIRPDDGSGDLWTTTPENMETVLSYLKTNDIATLTTSQAISEIQGQM